ncbi:hypothetical protein O181_003403 [Austropuccinia psidii MF-1]|uniref:Uncharacterized protein n=1 Tax=Austropuccinia psidii MF-1 TaxID=1389203 RepID=A0A9Q3GDI9_9BASI|nr:hypothetical protein [Austropuccinia psidii MF-1]
MKKISYHIEGMPGYKTADWEKFKVDIKKEWRTFSPERRYRLSSITDLLTKPQQEGGMRIMTQYRNFIGEYEAITTYLKRYQYIQGDINHNQKILASLSTSVQESIYKEMIKDRDIIQALDGEAVNSPRKNWNNNQEQRFPQNNQPYKPRNALPPFSSSYQSYITAQMAPRQPLKCAYCKEEGHSTTRYIHLAEDLDRRIVRTQGASYLFPNYQKVPMEGNESTKNIFRSFEKEQEELNKKFMEKPTVKPEPEEEVKPTEKKSEDKSTSIAHVEDWSNWKPPTISSANDPFE